MLGFFSNSLVRMQFLFPKLTNVLSIETPTHLAQEICLKNLIFSKMDAAVADSLPTVMNLIGNLTSNSPCFLQLTFS